MEIPDDVKRYYSRLLEVGGVKDPNLRYKIVVPENAERFPPHITLTSLLLYSPRCLRRIKRFIKGRDAYQRKIKRKQPMKINPRRRNKNRMIVVLVDRRRSTRSVVGLKRDKNEVI